MAKSHTFAVSTGVIALSSVREDRGVGGHMLVGLYPDTSNTCHVEITIAPDPFSAPASQWHTWGAGSVMVPTLEGLFAVPTGIRAHRTAGSGTSNVLLIHPE
jgi:hypothetical protein